MTDDYRLIPFFFYLLFETIAKNENNQFVEKFRRLVSREFIISKRDKLIVLRISFLIFNVYEEKQMNRKECERIIITSGLIENPSCSIRFPLE